MITIKYPIYAYNSILIIPQASTITGVGCEDLEVSESRTYQKLYVSIGVTLDQSRSWAARSGYNSRNRESVVNVALRQIRIFLRPDTTNYLAYMSDAMFRSNSQYLNLGIVNYNGKNLTCFAELESNTDSTTTAATRPNSTLESPVSIDPQENFTRQLL